MKNVKLMLGDGGRGSFPSARMSLVMEHTRQVISVECGMSVNNTKLSDGFILVHIGPV